VDRDHYEELLMQAAGERAERRRRAMVWALLLALAAMVLVPVIQAFT
jgi:hypothetical protein